MPKLFLTTAIALVMPGAVPVAYAAQQESAPPVVQIQANPRGDRPASPVPPNPAAANSPVPAAMPADPQYHAGPYVGALTPPPAEAMGKAYPLCSATITDSCQNPSEAGLGAMAHRAARHIHRRS